MSLPAEIRAFFDRHSVRTRGCHLIVAFSGGPDSTALLWGLQELAPVLGHEVHAVHVDHGLDGDSHRRAALAVEICRDLGAQITLLKRPVSDSLVAGESPEMAGRRIRYEALEIERQRLGGDFISTAHHADDQAETVLIRLLYGSGVAGLAGIRPRQGRVLRPLLGLRRLDLSRALEEAQIAPVRDPTNYCLKTVRNRVRHLLLPHLCNNDPDLVSSLNQLAESARGCRDSVEHGLRSILDLEGSPSGASINSESLSRLSSSIWPFALSMVHREAGIPYPPSGAARKELLRQLTISEHIGVDCGVGWRWKRDGDRLILSKPPPSTPRFAYTVEVPGECEIPELDLRIRIRYGVVEPWMFRPSSRRAGLDLPIEPGDRVVVRNRRVGDRVRPFGCRYTRRLKDLLIDRRVPRFERDRLPLLEVDSRLAWIPGVTVGDGYRVTDGKRAWIAELEPI